MKIRCDAVAVSSVLFTLALLIQTPAVLANAWTVSQTSLDIAHHLGVSNYYAPIGFASLTIIVIGLIVTWAGYIKGVRWTWFVMFVIVWVWAFPVLLLPYLQLWRNVVAITEWLPDAIKQSGPSRDFVEVVLIFVLMVLALVLPVKTLFLGAKGWLPSDRTKLTTDD